MKTKSKKCRSAAWAISIIIFYAACLSNAYAASITEGIVDGISGFIPGLNPSGNQTNKSDGISEIQLVFDDSSDIDLTEFALSHGNTNNTAGWAQFDPADFTVDLDIVTDTVTVTFSSIFDEWLEVEYFSSQYIYFGNLVGDANLDRSVSPTDALAVINAANNADYNYNYDIDSDGIVSASDALIIINKLNSDDAILSIADGPFGPSEIPQFFFPQDRQYIYSLEQSDNAYYLSQTPVPEPTTMLLLGVGLLGILGVRRKSHRHE